MTEITVSVMWNSEPEEPVEGRTLWLVGRYVDDERVDCQFGAWDEAKANAVAQELGNDFIVRPAFVRESIADNLSFEDKAMLMFMAFAK